MEAFYDERTDSLQRQLTTLDRQLNLLSRWRGWVFLGTLAMAFAAWSQLGPAIIFYPLAAVGLIAFLAIAARYEAAEEELKIVRTRLWINRRQQARAARNWDAVSGAIHDSPEDVTAVAADLDLMGRRSRYHDLYTRQFIEDAGRSG